MTTPSPGPQKIPIPDVGASKVEETTGATAGKLALKPLTPVQRAGLLLALGIALIVAPVTGWVITRGLIPVPNLPNPSDPAAKAAIENYKSLSTAALESALKLFDAVVTKVLFPAFSAVAGYIFGREHSESNERSESE